MPRRNCATHLPVEALVPMPTPKSRRHPNSCTQVLQKALARTGHKQKWAATKMVPRRPQRELMGSDSQQPTKAVPI